MVGMTGFEPATTWSQTMCSTKLSHIPIVVRPVGIEPATFWSVAKRSIQLSYERTNTKNVTIVYHIFYILQVYIRIFISFLSKEIWRYLTPQVSNSLFDTITPSVSLYLSHKYIISFIPDWMIILAHSLHGNKSTYIFAPSKSFLEPLKFNTAFNSAWHTYKYFVSRKNPKSNVWC